MAANPNWPLLSTKIAPNVDPFDPAAPAPVWQDITARVEEMESATGRQYETDLMQAGEATYTVLDKDEALNPTNPGSPYYPNLKVYRRIVEQAMWPPAPVGAATNLLAGQGVDPSFDSYAVGSLPSWITKVGGVNPVVSTTTPQQGTQDLSWSVVGGATAQGVSWTVTCIPGQQYTSSAYVQQSSASTQRITAAGVSGSSTGFTGLWVRLSVTFTATDTAHTVQIATAGTAFAGTVLLDAPQHELGATATAFATSGPGIYNLFGGYIERYPSNWRHQGMYGMAQLTCVDSFAMLANQALSTEYRNAVLAKKPDYYWPLGEGQSATRFAEASGNAGPPLVSYSSKYGPGVGYQSGQATAIPGDPGGMGVLFAEDMVSSIGTIAALGTILSTGQAGTPGIAPFPTTVSAPWAVTVALWVKMTATSVPMRDNNRIAVLFSDAYTISTLPRPDQPVTLTVIGSNGFLELKTQLSTAGNPAGAYFATTSFSLLDGAWHHVVAVVTQDATSTVQQVYVDGSLAANSTTATSTTGMLNAQCKNFQIGGLFASATWNYTLGGTVTHAAVWYRALTSTEVTDLRNAGKGYPGESSGARIGRYLGYYPVGQTAIDAGASTMDVSTLAENTALLDACQNVAITENGTFWVDGAGTTTFKARTVRYLTTTPRFVFGENTAGGELPYEPDITYDYDPSRVWNDVQVNRSGGVNTLGGTPAARTASQNAYGKRSLTRQVNTNSDLEAQDGANWLFGAYQQPAQRVSALTINPGANPALWPCALGARIGDRVTVKRRTLAGYTMTADYFIERIERRRAAGEYKVMFQMSPAPPNQQPWILGDPTYGVLGSTTLLGF